jgi:hypothetical protein
MEPEMKAQIDPEIYKEHLAFMEIALDVERITKALSKVRAESS